VRRSSAARAAAARPVDLQLGRCPGAAVDQQLPQLLGRDVVEVRATEPRLEPGTPVGVQARPGLRDQQRPLALRQIGGGGLARGRRVAEHAEQIVGELERAAQRVPDAVQPDQQVLVRTGQDRPDLQGTCDRVAARLEGRDPEGQLAVGAAHGRSVQVERLADHDLLAQQGEAAEGGQQCLVGDRGGEEQLVGVDEGQVAEEDGDRPSVGLGVPLPTLLAVPGGERLVDAGPAPSRRRLVDHVVVEQRAGVQQLQGERRAFDGLRPASARSLEPQQQQGGPDALPAGGEGPELVGERDHARMQRLDAGEQLVEGRRQRVVDPGAQAVQDLRGGRRRCRGVVGSGRGADSGAPRGWPDTVPRDPLGVRLGRS
jgi:hypothetical protein